MSFLPINALLISMCLHQRPNFSSSLNKNTQSASQILIREQATIFEALKFFVKIIALVTLDSPTTILLL